jgi:uncharacterized OsmC-like protein
MTAQSDSRTHDAPAQVVVHGRASSLAQQVTINHHRLVADEPQAAGGTDTGPGPYELLLAALGACTSMTLALYARRKQWPLESVTVSLRHSRVHAVDSRSCETTPVMLDRIDRDVELHGTLSEEQIARLLEIADKCQVHRTLTSSVDIQTRSIVRSENG